MINGESGRMASCLGRVRLDSPDWRRDRRAKRVGYGHVASARSTWSFVCLLRWIREMECIIAWPWDADMMSYYNKARSLKMQALLSSKRRSQINPATSSSRHPTNRPSSTLLCPLWNSLLQRERLAIIFFLLSKIKNQKSNSGQFIEYSTRSLATSFLCSSLDVSCHEGQEYMC